MITFGISGLWHGANWTFVIWGLLHGIAQCIERALGLHKREWHSWCKVLHIFATLFIVNIAWVLFRAKTISDAMIAVQQMFSPSDFTLATGKFTIILVLIVISIVFVKEIKEELCSEKLFVFNNSILSNYILPTFLLVCIGLLGVVEGGQFIYFQF